MPDSLKDQLIYPDWPAPASIKAVMTTRHGGVSQSPFDSLNLGDHVNDDPEAVMQNRARIRQQCCLPSEPVWLTQVHGTEVLAFDQASTGDSADAIVSHASGEVCTIMTADCLPVLFCNKNGTTVGAAHAGWRGLEAGVLEATLQQLKCHPEDVLIWMGAAISQDNFEVGQEVREAFVQTHSDAEQAFIAGQNGKWQADLYALARLRLTFAGVPAENIYGGQWCTYAQSGTFYSYRRESRTGRMASMIWIETPA